MNRQGPAAFIASEAGAAAWMAPVWAALDRSASAWISPIAEAHLRRNATLPPGSLRRLDDALAFDDAVVLIASATGRTLEAEAVARAAARGIASVQLIDYWSGYARRFCGRWPDRIAVIDARAASEAAAAGLPADRLVEVGQPSWEMARRLPAAPREHVAFIGQPLQRLYGGTLGYDEASAFDLLRMAQARRPDLISEILYVLHPEEEDGHAPAGIARTRDAARALARCGTVAGISSSLMVDALLGARSVVSLQPGAIGEDACALSRHGRIARVSTADELIEHLLLPPAPESGLAGALTGSTKRAVALIEGLARA